MKKWIKTVLVFIFIITCAAVLIFVADQVLFDGRLIEDEIIIEKEPGENDIGFGPLKWRMGEIKVDNFLYGFKPDSSWDSIFDDMESPEERLRYQGLANDMVGLDVFNGTCSAVFCLNDDNLDLIVLSKTMSEKKAEDTISDIEELLDKNFSRTYRNYIWTTAKNTAIQLFMSAELDDGQYEVFVIILDSRARLYF